MIGEKQRSTSTSMKNLSRKFSNSAITVCNNVMERSRVSNFKRTFSLRNIFHHQSTHGHSKSSTRNNSSSNHGFTFKRTPSRKLDIYFPFIRGPDVKPPRNERRTLKLQKTEDEGFGFWLQTYAFPKNGGEAQKRTFVRYVEDEGAAYMAGLREGDIIVEVGEQNVEQMDHIKIVQLITEEKTELRLVVKFIDAVRRVELAVRLKKKQTKLKTKEEELIRIKQQEYDLLNGIITYEPCGSPKSEDGDEISLHTSTESEISSISSTQSDELTVRTSKFNKRSSRVLDSIKELNCNDNVSGYSISDWNNVSKTTDDELLSLYCDKMDYHNSLPRGCPKNLKRGDSMPAHKYRSLPRKRIVDTSSESISNYTREYALDYSNEQFDSFDFDDGESSDDCSSSRSSIGGTVFQNLDRAPRRNRPKSYKMAMHSLKHLEGDVAEL
eukprot:TCONS_00046513-protein